MSRKNIVIVCLCAAFIVAFAALPALAQQLREPELADQMDSLYDNAATPASRQKFFSILIFLVLGGGAAYAVMRGIRKVVSFD